MSLSDITQGRLRISGLVIHEGERPGPKMAHWFAHLNSKQQAEFFDALAQEARAFPKPSCFQWAMMKDDLTKDAEWIIDEINDAANGPTIMQLADFHNALRVLRSIDYHEISDMPEDQWPAFRDDPYHFFIRCETAVREAIWRALMERMTG